MTINFSSGIPIESLDGRILLSGSNALDRIDFGNYASEAAHFFAPNVSPTLIARRGVGTVGASSGLTSRNPTGGPDLTFTVAVDPARQNYLSVRVWGNDVPTESTTLAGGSGVFETLEEGGGAVQFPNRFVYYTAAIPVALTAGKTSVQLTLDGGRSIYSAYTHTATMFVPDSADPAGTKPAVTGQATLDTLTPAEALGTVASPGILLSDRKSVFDAGGYLDRVLARQITASTTGAPRETYGLDLWTNVATFNNGSRTDDDWRDQIGGGKHGPGYSTVPDELLGVLSSAYLLKPFTDANGNTVAGLDRYLDPDLLNRIVALLDGTTYLQGSDGGFHPEAEADSTGIDTNYVWQGLTSTPRAAGHAYAGSTDRGNPWGLSLEGVDTYALGWAITRLLNEPAAAPAFKTFLGQTIDADLNPATGEGGKEMTRAAAYERMLLNQSNFTYAITGGTSSQHMFQELGMYASSVALNSLQALFPNAQYTNDPAKAFARAKETLGLLATSGMRGTEPAAGSGLSNYELTTKGLGEAHGALSSGFDGGGYGSILPWLAGRFVQLAEWDATADAAGVAAMRQMASATIDSYDQFLSPLEKATVNSSGVVTANTLGWGPEPYITYRDTKNVNNYAGGFEFNDQYFSADPAGPVANAYARRSAYLSTQYNLDISLNAGGGSRSINYLRDYAAYESTIRSLINVSPATLKALPAEPGQPDYAFADVQAGAVAFVNNGERFYANLDWRNYEYNGGFTNIKHSNIARVHYTTGTVERAATVVMPKDAANVQVDGNLAGVPIKSAKVLSYGDYLIVLNDGATTYAATLPAGAGQAEDLATGTTYTLGNTVNVAAGGYAIFWLNASSVLTPLANGQDIGAVGVAGSNSYAGGVHTVRGAGADLGTAADAFRLVSTAATGDTTVSAQVLSQTGGSDAEAGVIVRADATPGSPFAAVTRSPGNGLRFEYRTAAGAPSAWVAVPTPLTNVFVKLTRSGNSVAGYYSTDNATWTMIGTPQTIALPATAIYGLAVSSHDTAALSTATFGSVVVAPGTAPTVAATAAASASRVTGKTVALSVLGADAAGEAGLTYTWTAVGPTAGPVSFSENRSNAAKNTTATFTTEGVYTFRVLITDAGGAVTTSDVTVTVAATATNVVVSAAQTQLSQNSQVSLRATVTDQFGQLLERAPRIEWSIDGGGAGGTIDAAGVYTAPATGSGNATVRATAAGLSGTVPLTVQPALGAFTGTAAIGPAALPGSASQNNGAYTVSSGGNDIWSTSDQFRFVYIPLTGDGQITARVASMGNTSSNAKAGVMFRTSLDPSSPYAISYMTPNGGTRFEYRNTAGGTSASIGGGAPAGTPMKFVRITRTGSTLSAAYSSDGVAWTNYTSALANVAGTSANSTMYVGLAVCAVNVNQLNTATFDNVTVAEFRNRALGGTATATPAGGTNERAAQAFDGLTSTKWYGSPGTGATLQYDFGAGVAWSIKRYTITSANDVPARDPKDWTLQGSNDNSVWTDVDTRAAQTFANRLQTNTYDVAGATASYRYYRLNVTANAGGSNVGVQLSELTLVSSAAPGTTQGAPTFASPPAASASTVTGRSVNLSALAADNSGEAAMTYVWDLVNLPAGDVSFSANGTNAAKNTVATFRRAGVYTFRLTAVDPAGQTVSGLVTVTVAQTLTGVAVTPAGTTVAPGGTLQLTAVALDQFGEPLTAQPASFVWSLVSGVGTVSAAGLYTAPAASGSAVIRATTSGVDGSANVTVANQNPLVQRSSGATAVQTSATTAALSVPAVDDTGEAGLTYTWSVIGTPPSPVSFNVNGTNAAKDTVATFSAPGTYAFLVTMTDAGGLTRTTTVTLIAAAAPVVQSIVVNDGTAQRSMVKSLTVTFDRPVTLATGAFTLSLRSTSGAATSVGFAVSPTTGPTAAYVLSFTGTGGSLADGVYDLLIKSASIVDPATGLKPATDAALAFHRLFGDSDGNRNVNNADQQRFKSAYGSGSTSAAYSALFDYDANGAINNADQQQFKQRYGSGLTY